MSERLQGTIRVRTKVMRGMETEGTAKLLIDGFRLHYNHIKPHSGIGNKTPASKVGFHFVFHDWVEVAHLRERTSESPARQTMFKTRMITRRRGL